MMRRLVGAHFIVFNAHCHSHPRPHIAFFTHSLPSLSALALLASGGRYGLLNRTNYEPNPDWYIARAVHELMGDVVLTPPVGNFTEGLGYLRSYAQCSRAGTGVVLLLINIAPTTTFHVRIVDMLVSPRDE
jgi:hypothetical protein